MSFKYINYNYYNCNKYNFKKNYITNQYLNVNKYNDYVSKNFDNKQKKNKIQLCVQLFTQPDHIFEKIIDNNATDI